MSGRFTTPVTLVGQHLKLVPLAPEHSHALSEAVCDGDLFNLWYTSVPTPEQMDSNIARRLSLRALGSMLPFTVISAVPPAIVGMTSFMNIDEENCRVEIGSTWYATRVQRTALNTEAKFLLLRHAFEEFRCIAVEFRTHRLNLQSRRAIERLGAQLDGILRANSFARDGTIRDTCVYSITAAEWPAISSHLQWELNRPR